MALWLARSGTTPWVHVSVAAPTARFDPGGPFPPACHPPSVARPRRTAPRRMGRRPSWFEAWRRQAQRQPDPPAAPLRSPCARNAGSVHPFGEPASICGTRRCSRLGPGSTRSPQLLPRQGLPRRLLPPVRPRVGTDDAAARAHHPRPERRYRHVVRPALGAQHRP
jgi:hypothetical protein